MSWRLWVPLFLFALFLGLAAYQLTQPKDEFVASGMVGEELPYFDLPPAMDGVEGVSNATFGDGRPRLLNIWASWCLPCIAEAPHLESLERQGVEIVGVAIRDRPEDIARFLAQHGNPYSRIGRDDLSEVQLAIGSSGVPETFVIDGEGVIRYQHIGDVRASDVPVLLAQLEQAR
ncbi:DsbE family thiol:disulfide interchange protein [Qipengyuania sp. Mu-71]|jgi:cytochrome c biogenesis protein CcmG/thiol:disulfide interchange protein DsbE|uniref:DsbE family thiol:disulfide interchange protein n=1 Tax=Qipengyuania sp. Mu-71 TaxID=3121477 RepID=UPI002FE4A23C